MHIVLRGRTVGFRVAVSSGSSSVDESSHRRGRAGRTTRRRTRRASDKSSRRVAASIRPSVRSPPTRARRKRIYATRTAHARTGIYFIRQTYTCIYAYKCTHDECTLCRHGAEVSRALRYAHKACKRKQNVTGPRVINILFLALLIAVDRPTQSAQ